jgi:hypothetical protein
VHIWGFSSAFSHFLLLYSSHRGMIYVNQMTSKQVTTRYLYLDKSYFLFDWIQETMKKQNVNVTESLPMRHARFRSLYLVTFLSGLLKLTSNFALFLSPKFHMHEVSILTEVILQRVGWRKLHTNICTLDKFQNCCTWINQFCLCIFKQQRICFSASAYNFMRLYPSLYFPNLGSLSWADPQSPAEDYWEKLCIQCQVIERWVRGADEYWVL